ncbi:hypothetical protein E2C01_102286 [Portunus trituberculatus]|uniref:Uncharacterized protein n=1 Tax=Portunus trituberculatus TaxID=210409 RepID=A0A5B7K7S2_PORTR|nr:hypothetical protein [Portunus trituberculatus]
MITSLWLLTAFVLGIVYRCNLKAMLILPTLNIPFDSLEELVTTGKIVGILEGTNIQHQIWVLRNDVLAGLNPTEDL